QVRGLRCQVLVRGAERVRFSGLKARNLIARAEGPGNAIPQNPRALQGRNKSARANWGPTRTHNRDALPGLARIPGAFNPGLQPGLSNCGPSALKTDAPPRRFHPYLTSGT